MCGGYAGGVQVEKVDSVAVVLEPSLVRAAGVELLQADASEATWVSGLSPNVTFRESVGVIVDADLGETALGLSELTPVALSSVRYERP